MRVDYDPVVRAWYLTLSDTTVSTTVHVSEEVAVDVDADQLVVGVEFLLAPAEIEPQTRDELFRRFPVVRQALAEFQSGVA